MLLLPLGSGGFRVSLQITKVLKFLPRFSPNAQRVSLISVSAVMYCTVLYSFCGTVLTVQQVRHLIRGVRWYTCHPEIAVVASLTRGPRDLGRAQREYTLPYHAMLCMPCVLQFISLLRWDRASTVAWQHGGMVACQSFWKRSIFCGKPQQKNNFQRGMLFLRTTGKTGMGSSISNVRLAKL